MLQILGKTLRESGNLSKDALEICTASLAPSTSAQYNHHIKEFQSFCEAHDVTSFLSVPVTLPIEFLTSLFKKGKSYSTINSARSALSQFVHLTNASYCDFGKHPLTTKFMKGVYKLRPPTPKYRSTWDVSLVLNKMRLINNLSCSIKELSHKCVMLIALATGQRVQTLRAMRQSCMVSSADKFTFSFDSILKTSRPGVHHIVNICRFSHDLNICPFQCLTDYLNRTKEIRNDNDSIFTSFQRPFAAVSSQTISRWLVTTLRECGINSSFTAHSTRTASSSKAALFLPIDTVLKSVGWRSEATFANFYKKVIVTEDSEFGNCVLNTSL